LSFGGCLHGLTPFREVNGAAGLAETVTHDLARRVAALAENRLAPGTLKAQDLGLRLNRDHELTTPISRTGSLAVSRELVRVAAFKICSHEAGPIQRLVPLRRIRMPSVATSTV
jgi:hypothetical protein